MGSVSEYLLPPCENYKIFGIPKVRITIENVQWFYVSLTMAHESKHVAITLF
jgi:hypothetical protein